MDRELLKGKIAKTQRELSAATQSMQNAIANFYIKRGELKALIELVNQLEPKMEKFTENQN